MQAVLFTYVRANRAIAIVVPEIDGVAVPAIQIVRNAYRGSNSDNAQTSVMWAVAATMETICALTVSSSSSIEFAMRGELMCFSETKFISSDGVTCVDARPYLFRLFLKFVMVDIHIIL